MSRRSVGTYGDGFVLPAEPIGALPSDDSASPSPIPGYMIPGYIESTDVTRTGRTE